MTSLAQQLQRRRVTVRQAIQQHALRPGPVTLASGRTSMHFFDLTQLLVVPTAGALAALLRHAVADLDFRYVGGPAVGAVPIAMLSLTADRDDVAVFYTQKKDQETVFCGHPLTGEHPRVLVVDDVTTTGSSLLETIRVVEAAGGHVVRILTVLDRLEGARAALVQYDFRALFTVQEFDIPEASS